MIRQLKATTKAASIEVSVQIGECKLSETFSVVAPSSIYMEQFPNTQVKHITGTASCGFIGAVYLRPDDVSFSEVEIQEQEAPAITSGCFTSAQGQMHELGAWEEASDNTWPGKGTYVTSDTVWSGADFTGPTFTDGQFTWYIPVKFRVKKESSSGTVFTVQIHHMALSGADGSMRISKNGVLFSRKASDPTTDYQ